MENNATTGDLLGSAVFFASVKEADANGQRTQFVAKDSLVLSVANQRHRQNKLRRPPPKGHSLFGEEQKKRQH